METREMFTRLETILDCINRMTDKIPFYITHQTSAPMAISIEKLLQNNGFQKYETDDKDHYTYRFIACDFNSGMLQTSIIRDYYVHFAPAREYNKKLPEGSIAITTGMYRVYTGSAKTEWDCQKIINRHIENICK